jgi:hypothetical protein
MENQSAIFLGIAKDTWTLLGAGIAGLTGLMNFAWQWLDRHDRIFVSCSSLSPSIEQYNSLYVVNTGKNPVQLRDYGYVLYNGKLMSLPWHWEIEEPSMDSPNSYTDGDKAMKPQGIFHAGMEFRGSIVGVWAITATQHRPRLAFAFDTPIFRQLFLRIRHAIAPVYC